MKKTAFIGIGNMATAIINGMTRNGAFPWSEIILHNRHIEKIASYAEKGALIAPSLQEAVSSAECVFLCVKPQNFPEILTQISDIEGVQRKLFVTIAAGISTETVSRAAGGAPVVRAMPNTPMLISQGVVAVCRNQAVTDEQFNYVNRIFGFCGSVITIDEADMNKIICVTGSSPAYVFMLIKAMFEGAVAQGLLANGNNGLSEQELINSICDTIIGSAALMKAGTKTPAEQIQTVASKGGTTECAIAELEKYEFCESIVSAMQKCTDRAEELSGTKS